MMRRTGFLLLFAALILAADFFSKLYVHTHIPLIAYSPYAYPYGGIAVFQDWHGIDFSINHIVNTGAAWGFLSSFQQPLLYLRMVIIGGILSYLIFAKQSAPYRIPLTLVVTGAIGNVIDHFLYGHVIDMFMFHFHRWNYTFPLFNIADSAIFCGISWMLIQSFFTKKQAV
jgi:signal peptidase II